MEDLPHILVVDDDTRLRTLLRKYLSDNGYLVTVAADAAEARAKMVALAVDLLVLDVMMPGEDGLSLTRRLRGQGVAVPIVMLTAMGEDTDRIVGLEMGADDYVPKPFNPRELLARIKAVLRPDGVVTTLSAGEFDLLLAFVEHPRRVLSRDQLLDFARGRQAIPFDRSIDIQVSRLRRKLGDEAKDPQLIKTVRGGGYVLATTVEKG
jgi:two-component system OmpR family response regulator